MKHSININPRYVTVAAPDHTHMIEVERSMVWPQAPHELGLWLILTSQHHGLTALLDLDAHKALIAALITELPTAEKHHLAAHLIAQFPDRRSPGRDRRKHE